MSDLFAEHPLVVYVLLVFVLPVLIIGVIAGAFSALGRHNPYNYTYVDTDGNEGYAQWCHHDKIMNCYTEDGYVQVKEYHKND